MCSGCAVESISEKHNWWEKTRQLVQHCCCHHVCYIIQLLTIAEKTEISPKEETTSQHLPPTNRIKGLGYLVRTRLFWGNKLPVSPEKKCFEIKGVTIWHPIPTLPQDVVWRLWFSVSGSLSLLFLLANCHTFFLEQVFLFASGRKRCGGLWELSIIMDFLCIFVYEFKKMTSFFINWKY